MAQQTMYPAQANSPATELSGSITNSATTIGVLSAGALPAAPNMVTLGTDETAEVVLYTGVSGNNLTGCTRGFGGTTAKSWAAGTRAARYFTAYDHEAVRGNIADHETRIVAVKATADAAETPAGAQAKANTAQAAANGYADTQVQSAKDYADAQISAALSTANPVGAKLYVYKNLGGGL